MCTGNSFAFLGVAYFCNLPALLKKQQLQQLLLFVPDWGHGRTVIKQCIW